MTMELTDPTHEPTRANARRRTYKRLYDLLQQNPGQWVRVDLDDISGDTPTIKQSRILTACYLRGLRVQTTREQDYIYVRLRTDEVTQ